MIRLDFIFSNWIFVWFIFYYNGWIQYSPILLLVLGVLCNIYLTGCMIANGVRHNTVIQYVILVFFLKVVPAYLIRNDKLKMDDIIFSLLLVNLFLAWLLLNGTDLVQILSKIRESLIHDKLETPILALLQNLENKFKG